MKIRHLALFIWSALLTVGTTGCNDDQTSMSLEEIGTKAVIRGHVVYSEGVEYVDGKYLVDKQKFATGKRVFVEVNYDQYKKDTVALKGTRIFETVVNEAGEYAIEIPVVTDGINVSLRMENFIGTRSEYKGMKDGTPEFTVSQARFSYEKGGINLKPYGVYFENIAYNYDSEYRFDENEYRDSVTIRGRVVLAREKGLREGEYAVMPGKSVLIQVEYEPGKDVVSFGAVTDASGTYTVVVPVKSRKGKLPVTVTPLAVGENNFTHYTAAGSVMLSGYYANKEVKKEFDLVDIDNFPYEIEPVYMTFTPFAPVPGTWSNDLAGWVLLKGYDKRITLQGNVLQAREDGYRQGSYEAAGKVDVTLNIVYTDDDNRQQAFLIATDANGNYTLSLPIKKEDSGVTVSSIRVANQIVREFRHYTDVNGNSGLLAGTYAVPSEGTITNKILNVNVFESVYNVGTTYMKFTPAVEPESWSADLPGWYKVPGTDISVRIEGRVQMGIERGYGETGWTDASRINVRITVADRNFDVATDNSGEYRFDYPVIDGLSDMEVLVAGESFKVTNFRHYTGIGSSRQIAGEYRMYNGISLTDNISVQDNICTVANAYMTFVPEVVPEEWSFLKWYPSTDN